MANRVRLWVAEELLPQWKDPKDPGFIELQIVEAEAEVLARVYESATRVWPQVADVPNKCQNRCLSGPDGEVPHLVKKIHIF